MIETAIALVFAHLLADFVFQTNRMVETKGDPLTMTLHIGLVAVLSWAALGFPLSALPIAIIAGSHLVIDLAKTRLSNGGFLPFLLDQAAHLLVIFITADQFPALFGLGLWAQFGQIQLIAYLPHGFLMLSGLVGTVFAGIHAVRLLMRDIDPDMLASPGSLPKGGEAIGQLERLMIFMLVLADTASAIGFLIAAKSVLRFNDMQHNGDASDAAKQAARRASEYVIIGTLASFAWALAVSFATRAALEILGTP